MAVDAARVKSLFLEASELADPAERAAYLAQECGGDAELRRRVEALLAAAHDGGGRQVEGDATGTSELTSPETREATTAPDADTRQPSELATAEDRSDGASSRSRAPARRPSRQIRRGPGHRRPLHPERSHRRGRHGLGLPRGAGSRSSARSPSS